MNNHRYPGLRPFEVKDSLTFFGRDREVSEFLNILHTQDISVLYGKAGIGKTSLINAGLYPQIKNDKNQVYSFRLLHINNNNSLMDEIRIKLPTTENNILLDKISNTKSHLWYQLKTIQLAQSPEAFIFIFDQFEELNLIDFKKVIELFNELSQITSHNIPQEVQQFIINKKNKITPKEKNDLLENIPLKIIISLRTNYLNLLTPLIDFFPSIFRNAYELNAPTIENAKMMLLNPASVSSKEFTSSEFKIEDKAIEYILNDLYDDSSDKFDLIQLQIHAQYLERSVIERKISIFQKEDVTNISEISENFYLERINSFEELEKTKIRKFIEEGLLFEGKRLIITEGVEKQYGIGEVSIRKLLNTRLIRSEKMQNGFGYEISSQYLVPMIQKAYLSRKEEEDLSKKEEEEKALRVVEENRKIELRKAKRRTVVASILGTIGAILAFLALNFYFISEQQAKEAMKNAEHANRSERLAMQKVMEASLALEKAELEAKQLTKIIKEKEIKNLVFIQVSSKSLYSTAEEIKQLLVSKGYETPGIEIVRKSFTSSIKYFHSKDARQARIIKGLVEDFLRKEGRKSILKFYRIDSPAVDGQIEIWLN